MSEYIEIDFTGYWGVFKETKCLAAFKYFDYAKVFVDRRLSLNKFFNVEEEIKILEINRKMADATNQEPDETLAVCARCER